MLHLVFGDFNDCLQHSRVDCRDLIIRIALLEDCRDLLDELFDTFFSELPAAMEDLNGAILSKEGKNGVCH